MIVRAHDDAQRLSRRVHDRTLHKTADKVSSKLQESNYPVRDFKSDQGLGPWIPSCLLAWSDANLIPLMDTCVMYWLDLSKAGLTFKKVLPPMLRVISRLWATSPTQQLRLWQHPWLVHEVMGQMPQLPTLRMTTVRPR